MKQKFLKVKQPTELIRDKNFYESVLNPANSQYISGKESHSVNTETCIRKTELPSMLRAGKPCLMLA
jgi:hypothetical protein